MRYYGMIHFRLFVFRPKGLGIRVRTTETGFA